MSSLQESNSQHFASALCAGQSLPAPRHPGRVGLLDKPPQQHPETGWEEAASAELWGRRVSWSELGTASLR